MGLYIAACLTTSSCNLLSGCEVLPKLSECQRTHRQISLAAVYPLSSARYKWCPYGGRHLRTFAVKCETKMIFFLNKHCLLNSFTFDRIILPRFDHLLIRVMKWIHFIQTHNTIDFRIFQHTIIRSNPVYLVNWTIIFFTPFFSAQIKTTLKCWKLNWKVIYNECPMAHLQLIWNGIRTKYKLLPLFRVFKW